MVSHLLIEFLLFADETHIFETGKSNGKAIAIYSVEKLFLKVLKFAHNYSFVVAIQLSIMSVITGYFQWKSGALIENWKLFIPMMCVFWQQQLNKYSS